MVEFKNIQRRSTENNEGYLWMKKFYGAVYEVLKGLVVHEDLLCTELEIIQNRDNKLINNK